MRWSPIAGAAALVVGLMPDARSVADWVARVLFAPRDSVTAGAPAVPLADRDAVDTLWCWAARDRDVVRLTVFGGDSLERRVLVRRAGESGLERSFALLLGASGSADTTDSLGPEGATYRIQGRSCRDTVRAFARVTPSRPQAVVAVRVRGRTVSFGLGRGFDDGAIDLFDVTGRRRGAYRLGRLGAGWARFDLPASVPPGVYLVCLSRGAERVAATKVIVR